MEAFHLTAFLVLMASFQTARMKSAELDSDEMEPRYSYPEVDVAFMGYDIDQIHNVANWQDCGM